MLGGMPLAYAVERITERWDELSALSAAHFAEVADLPEGKGLCLDRDGYAGAERAGAHVFVVAREAGRMVGYLSMFLRRHVHAHVLSAYQDAIYLMPEQRQGWNAQGLIAHADTWLREHGVDIVYQFVPTAHDFGPVLRHLGYNPTEIVWSRHLHPAEKAN
jgi:GNAT superfamily N-acetyltransferase